MSSLSFSGPVLASHFDEKSSLYQWRFAILAPKTLNNICLAQDEESSKETC